MPESGSEIPRIYSLADAAELLGVRRQWLRGKLADGQFEALKRGGRWAMTEPQILSAIEQMTVRARRTVDESHGVVVVSHESGSSESEAVDYFASLSARSQTYWRNRQITGSTRRPGRQPKSS